MLSQIIQESPTPTFVIDNNHIITHWNKACEKLTGISANEIIGTNKQWSAFYSKERPVMADLLVDDAPEEKIASYYSDKYRQSALLKGAYEAEDFFSNIGKKGKWLFFTAGQLRDAEAKVIGVIETLQDITERKPAEEVIQESEARYRTIFENTKTATIIIEEDTTISLVNMEFEKLTGYSKDEIEGNKSIREFLVKDEVAKLEEYHYLRITDPSADPTNFETRIIDRQDNVHDVYMTADTIPGTKKSIASLLDISERKQLEKEVQHRAKNLSKAMVGTVQAMGLIVDYKDPHTAGHQQRVAKLALAVAKEMGLSDDRIEGIHMAALIHDIGKISIPYEILSKSSRLSNSEFAFIKEHSQVGYDILKDIEFPWPVAQIVLQHHERMDGSGYPQGLSGEDIILEARILAVADAVEAMASHRPHRPALGIDKAFEEISKAKIYDPNVVDACLRLFRKKGLSLDSCRKRKSTS